MRTIRGGNGLGDSLYVQAIARHLVKKGEKLEVCTSWPDVFSQLDVSIGPFRRNSVDIVAHYVQRKQIRDTTQFEDCCIKAGIEEPVDFRIDWTSKNQIKQDKPIIVVGLPRLPMDRKDGFGTELLPDCKVIQRAIDLLKDRAFIVQVGTGKSLYEFSGIDLDLANKTTVKELLDIASSADGFLGYCSFLIPLAESFAKPILVVWSSAGMKSSTMFIRLVRPHKLLHRSTSCFVLDTCSGSQLVTAVDELLEQARDKTAVYWKEYCDSRERAIFA